MQGEAEDEDPSLLDVTVGQTPYKDRWVLDGGLPVTGFNFESVKEVQLSSRKREALSRDRDCQRLLKDKLALESWFYNMFRLFAHKFDQAGQYMRLADVLQFFRLSGLRAVFFDEQAIQVYHTVRNLRGLTAGPFLRKFLPDLGSLSIWFPLDRLVQEFMYPHLVTHLRAAGFRYIPDEVVEKELLEENVDPGQFYIHEGDYYEEIYAVKCYSCIQKSMGRCVACLANSSSALAKLLFVCARLTSADSAEKTRVVPEREEAEEEVKTWNEAVAVIIEVIEYSEKERGLSPL